MLCLAAWEVGRRAATAYEEMLIQRVSNGLEVLGYDWAEVRADGLQLELHGHAPDLFARDLAHESAVATAPMASIDNYATAAIAPPENREPVRVELHRDERGVTMTGQTASRHMRQKLNAALAQRAGPELRIYDLTGIQAATPPIGWGPEISVAATAAAALPNAYVVMEPGQVFIDGQVLDKATLDQLTRSLEAQAQNAVTLSLRLRIPSQIIAPFDFLAERTAGEPMRLERCSVRSEGEERFLMQELAKHIPDIEEAGCQTGLGGPAGDWISAVLKTADALAEIPAGRVELAYRSVRLIAAPPTTQTEFENVLAALNSALPEGYGAEGTLLVDDVASRLGLERDRFWMQLALSDEGVAMTGQVPDPETELALRTYAAALFGTGNVNAELSATGTTPPANWRIAAMAAMDQLALGAAGEARLAGYSLTLTGRLPRPELVRQIHRELTLGLPDYRVSTLFQVDLPKTVAAIPLPPVRCAARLNRLINDRPIDFDTGSAKIAEDSVGVLDLLAAEMRRCTPAPILIGGHTDAQGSEEVNLRISQQRADAVATALVERGVPLQRLRAAGFGESIPIADNQTEAGRARNRRIEFQPAN